MIDEIWHSSGTILFRVCDDSPGYALPYVAIEKITWEQSNRARMILYGPLPLADEYLAKIKDGVFLDLLYKECGPAWDYYFDEVIVHFTDCKIKRKWTPLAKSIGEKQGEIRLYISLECEYRRGPRWTKTESS